MLDRPTKKITLKEIDVELYTFFNTRDKMTWLEQTTKHVDYANPKQLGTAQLEDVVKANVLLLPRMVVALFDKEGKKLDLKDANAMVEYLMENTTDGDLVVAEIGNIAHEVISPNGRGGSLQSSSTPDQS